MRLFLAICILISIGSLVAAWLHKRYEICKAMLRVDEFRVRTGLPLPRRGGLGWWLFLLVYKIVS
jgi:hypothetical protein